VDLSVYHGYQLLLEACSFRITSQRISDKKKGGLSNLKTVKVSQTHIATYLPSIQQTDAKLVSDSFISFH
jgi:hypothetical protein